MLDHEALTVDPEAKQVIARTAGGDIRRIEYDKLLIATGAESIKPPIKGLDSPGVFLRCHHFVTAIFFTSPCWWLEFILLVYCNKT